MNNKSQWCFAWYVQPVVEGQLRGALQKNAKWGDRSTLTISFLDGDPALHERVKAAALNWVGPRMANLDLDFRKNTHQTDIRISFLSSGSWSTIGTTCRNVRDITQPTMNFGWLNTDTPDAELKPVVLHEFGHALGLIHEHQNPAGGIQWNRQQVIADLSGPPNNWSLQQIEFNMFKPFECTETNYTKTDDQSIMMYPIPEIWTSNGFSVGQNTGLSEMDRKFIRDMYR